MGIALGAVEGEEFRVDEKARLAWQLHQHRDVSTADDGAATDASCHGFRRRLNRVRPADRKPAVEEPAGTIDPDRDPLQLWQGSRITRDALDVASDVHRYRDR